ncbi:hypothetical protein D3C72_2198500 [compost metagenome]
MMAKSNVLSGSAFYEGATLTIGSVRAHFDRGRVTASFVLREADNDSQGSQV